MAVKVIYYCDDACTAMSTLSDPCTTGDVMMPLGWVRCFVEDEERHYCPRHGGCNCGEVFGTRPAAVPKCDYCRLGTRNGNAGR